MEVNEVIDEDGKINEKLEGAAKGYFLDTKVLGWIIIICMYSAKVCINQRTKY